ncbi:hypothetical protein SCUCBS95973_006083 [Sporothrix curviconia]|uniref:Cell wall protein n=1 Tax=Sporothrix curviconia TaxID=1260050 RepID=A0ABP0C464_9PEZI
MRFSTIASVAAFASGVFAAPQPAVEAKAVAAAAKRVDLSSIVSELTTDVADVINQATQLSAKVQVASSLADATLVANLTSDMVTLNVSLTGVVNLLNQLGLGDLADPVETVASGAEGVVGGILGVVTGAVGTVLSTAGGLLSGLTGAAGGVVSGVTSAVPAATARDTTTTAVTNALGGLTNASALTSLIGGLLTAVGDLLGNLTVTISTGSLGDLSSLTNLTSATGALSTATAADPVSDLTGTLEGLVVAAVSVLANLLGGI